MITARLVLFAAILCAPVAAFASVWSPKAVADVAPLQAEVDVGEASAARAETVGDWVVMGDPTRSFFVPPGAFAGLLNDGDGDDGDGGGAGVVPCGEGRPAVTPNNGICGLGYGQNQKDAETRSAIDCMKRLVAYSKVTCGQCEDLSTCRAFASVLFNLVETTSYQSGDGWECRTCYTGPYFVVCESCD